MPVVYKSWVPERVINDHFPYSTLGPVHQKRHLPRDSVQFCLQFGKPHSSILSVTPSFQQGPKRPTWRPCPSEFCKTSWRRGATPCPGYFLHRKLLNAELFSYHQVKARFKHESASKRVQNSICQSLPRMAGNSLHILGRLQPSSWCTWSLGRTRTATP